MPTDTWKLEHTLSLLVGLSLPEQGNERLIEGYCSVQVIITTGRVCIPKPQSELARCLFQKPKGPLAWGLNGRTAHGCFWDSA